MVAVLLHFVQLKNNEPGMRPPADTLRESLEIILYYFHLESRKFQIIVNSAIIQFLWINKN